MVLNQLQIPRSANDSSLLPPSGAKATKPAGKASKANAKILQQYVGSLVRISVLFPIFASATTICLYVAPGPHIHFLGLGLEGSDWYAPVYGSLFTCIVLLLCAIFHRSFATASKENMHVYGMLARYHAELKARLGEPDHPNDPCEPYENGLPKKVLDVFNNPTDSYILAALRKAHEAYCDLEHLFANSRSVEWTLGAGYIQAWRMIHSVQEALVEAETLSEVISDAMHDVRAIQNSKMPGHVALTQRLLYAVNAIFPGAMVYFEDLKGDKNFSDIFPDKEKIQPPDCTHESQAAREALRQVKHALNAYQDSLCSALIRARNYLSASIVVTGLVTHLLLCLMILLGHTPNPGAGSDPYRSAIVTAAVYYITGAVAGLFGRFYNEANSDSAPDDYGLFLSRLIATPLLSGLAAIGGVLITSPLHPVDKRRTSATEHGFQWYTHDGLLTGRCRLWPCTELDYGQLSAESTEICHRPAKHQRRGY